MMQIKQIRKVTPQFKALFREDEPGSARLTSAFTGLMKARFFTDDSKRPTWGVVQEGYYGTLFLGGAVTTEIIEHLIARLKPIIKEVLITLWEDDPRLEIVPKVRDYEGYAVDFWDRQGDLEQFLAPIPDGCKLLTLMGAISMSQAGVQKIENRVEYALEIEDEIVSSADAGYMGDNIMELGTETHRDHRGKGYATLLCAHVIKACEDAGRITYWNTNYQNVPSLKLARKLGYRQERRCRLFAWM